MKIGVLNMTNFYDWMFLTYGMLRIVSDISATIYVVRLLVKNAKEQYVDVIKILQTSFVSLWFISDIFTILIPIFDSNLLDNSIVTVITIITDPFVLWYGLNQFAWLILVQHLVTYRKLAKGENYLKIRKIIKKKEIKLFISVMLFLTFLISIQITLHLLKTTNAIDQDLAKNIINFQGIILNIFFAISEYFLYLKTSKTLEKCLNFYYIKNKKKMRNRMLLNIWYFSIFSVLFILNILVPSNANLMISYNVNPPYDNALNIIFMLLILLTDIALFVYGWFNAKHLKFKDWLIIVMEGYRILHHFNGWSIFIIKWRYIKIENNQTDIVEEDNSSSLDESFNWNFVKDYDEDSGYQRAFKNKYILNSNRNNSEKKYVSKN